MTAIAKWQFSIMKRRIYMKIAYITDKERRFIEENHDMVYRFMSRFRLDENEYYGIVIEGLIKAVQDYLGNVDLVNRYAFSTIAFRRMKTCVYNHKTRENRQKRKPKYGLYSFDAMKNFNDCIGDIDVAFEEKLLEIELASIMTMEQLRLAELLLLGFAKKDIVSIMDCTRKQIDELHLSIKDKLGAIFY